VRSTFTTPSSGSGWATTKPWQAFAHGTVCFFHPEYDTQGHIIPTLAQANDDVYCADHGVDEGLRHLARWLRVRDSAELYKRVHELDANHDAWWWLVQKQRRLYDRACDKLMHVKMIERRLGLA
jgi:hypothetical protein